MDEVSFSTCVRSFLALAVSPFLMSFMRLLRALSSEFCLLLVELLVDEVEDDESSVKRLLLCKAEMDMLAILFA